jgi:hypothetical protein
LLRRADDDATLVRRVVDDDADVGQVAVAVVRERRADLAERADEDLSGFGKW